MDFFSLLVMGSLFYHKKKKTHTVPNNTTIRRDVKKEHEITICLNCVRVGKKTRSNTLIRMCTFEVATKCFILILYTENRL